MNKKLVFFVSFLSILLFMQKNAMAQYTESQYNTLRDRVNLCLACVGHVTASSENAGEYNACHIFNNDSAIFVTPTAVNNESRTITSAIWEQTLQDYNTCRLDCLTPDIHQAVGCHRAESEVNLVSVYTPSLRPTSVVSQTLTTPRPAAIQTAARIVPVVENRNQTTSTPTPTVVTPVVTQPQQTTIPQQTTPSPTPTPIVTTQQSSPTGIGTQTQQGNTNGGGQFLGFLDPPPSQVQTPTAPTIATQPLLPWCGDGADLRFNQLTPSFQDRISQEMPAGGFNTGIGFRHGFLNRRHNITYGESGNQLTTIEIQPVARYNPRTQQQETITMAFSIGYWQAGQPAVEMRPITFWTGNFVNGGFEERPAQIARFSNGTQCLMPVMLGGTVEVLVPTTTQYLLVIGWQSAAGNPVIQNGCPRTLAIPYTRSGRIVIWAQDFMDRTLCSHPLVDHGNHGNLQNSN